MATTYEPIATTTLGSAASTITFSTISGSYTDLVVIFRGIETTNDFNLLRFNGDTGSNYSHTEIYGDGSSAQSGRGSNRTTMYFGRGQTTPNSKILHILNYSNTTTYKTTLSRNNSDSVGAFVNLWRSTSAITSIEFSRGGGNYDVGTTVTLYGIKAA